MAYCLRALPGNAAQLIEEVRSHWKDLAALKAAGGTPAARLIKVLIIDVYPTDVTCMVDPQYEDVYFRVYEPTFDRSCEDCSSAWWGYGGRACGRCPNPHICMRSEHLTLDYRTYVAH